jgi:hypothetical protein
MRLLSLAALALMLALPAAAQGLRPLPRPAAVEAFAGATDLAPRRVVRPAAGPAPAVLRPVRAPHAAAHAPPAAVLAPAASVRRLTGPAAAPDPIADPARGLDAARGLHVTLSAANARAPVFLPVALALPRPAARPEPAAGPAVLRPRTRPAALAAPERVVASAFVAAPSRPAVTSPRPAARPRGLAPRRPAPPEVVVRAVAAPRLDPGRTLVVPKKGALCGDPRLRGEKLAPIGSRTSGCGIADPVRVREVDGVRLSMPATLDCGTARALADWVTRGLKPAAGKAGVAEIRVAAHYACRTRNNVRGARISEHGRGRAIDIAGITLGNGKPLMVLGDYRRSDMLRQVRRAACGIFGTTLGPGSDRYHNDHFHFDTARHRSGPYCR